MQRRADEQDVHRNRHGLAVAFVAPATAFAREAVTITSDAVKMVSNATRTGYAPVNGLNMYYEIHGAGQPLVVLHGSFMTIELMGSSSRSSPRAGRSSRREPAVKITASAISLNVNDVAASAAFVKDHFGFSEDMAAEGFVSLSREDAGFNLIFLRTGLATFKPESLRGRRADGLLVVFVVNDIDGEYARLQAEGVSITTLIETEPWGERFFQVTDPNGVTFQLVQWVVNAGE